MITDQSQPPEAGARQVVYIHTHTHRDTRRHTQAAAQPRSHTRTGTVHAAAGERE